MEGTYELFVRPVLHWTDQDTVAVVVVEDTSLLITSIGGKWEYYGEVGLYLLLGIDDSGEDVVGACLQCFHRFVFDWGSSLGICGLDFLPDLFHVAFLNGHGRS